MILQSTAVRVSKISEEKAIARLKSHLKYLQYRQHNREQGRAKKRHFFNGQSGHVDRRWIQQSIMRRRTGNVYYYCLLLTPAHDEPVKNWHQWTRAILLDLENRFKQALNWYAIVHDEAEIPHVHILLQGTGKNHRDGQYRPVIFKAHDFAFLCEQGRIYSEYRLQRLLREQLCFLDQNDTIGNDVSSKLP